MIHLSDK